jgi:hypothetical protein
MLAKAYDENDDAFDAYFYWLCDGSMSFGNMAGGGGGGYGAGVDGAAGWDRDASSLRMNGVRWNGLGYVDRLTGDAVSYDEVYNNYIIPGSKYSFVGAAAQGLVTSIQSGGVKDFEGVRVFTLNFGNFKKGAAMTIPGIGIFVGPGGANDIDLLRHEFGHIIQNDKWGSKIFWVYIVPTSVKSANRANIDPSFNHMDTWTEWSANLLSYRYFNQPSDWNETRFPTFPTTVRPGIMPPFVVGPFDFKFNWLDN